MTVVQVISFGYGHAPAPEADVTVDARRLLLDPHVDPGMREMTGLDEPVRRHVLATRGAQSWVEHEAASARALLTTIGQPVTVAFGCTGGRHRSVVMASECARLLSAAGFEVTVEHRDVSKPVIQRTGEMTMATKQTLAETQGDMSDEELGREQDREYNRQIVNEFYGRQRGERIAYNR